MLGIDTFALDLLIFEGFCIKNQLFTLGAISVHQVVDFSVDVGLYATFASVQDVTQHSPHLDVGLHCLA